MVQFDDSLEKLQEFVNLLVATTGQVRADLGTLAAHAAEVGQIAGAVEERLGGFTTDVETQTGEVRQGEEAAAEAIEHLTELARVGASDRLEDARAEVAATEQALEDRLAAERADLEREIGELVQVGFDGLATGLEAVGADVTSENEEADRALERLREGLDGLENTLGDARESASEALASAAETVGDRRDQLEDDVAEMLGAWSGELPGNLQGEASAVADAVGGLYQGFGRNAETEGDELIAEVAGVLDASARFVAPESSGALAEGCARADGQMQELGAAWADANAALEAGAGITDVLQPMVEQLETARRVVAEVDQALKALE